MKRTSKLISTLLVLAILLTMMPAEVSAAEEIHTAIPHRNAESSSALDMSKSVFSDVSADEYYYNAVQWAYEGGITNGTSTTTFGPDEFCSRAQIVTFLWNAAGKPGSLENNPFVDVLPGTYYYTAVLWAVESGITTGTASNEFSPDAICTRAQAVTFLHRYEKTPAVEETSGFIDVDVGAYYADAVNWAAKNGITTGTDEGVFSPDMFCTRAQIVTFLYRDMVEYQEVRLKEIFSKTVDDFPGQTVINLDNDPTTNFIVYSENVKVVDEEEEILSVDEEHRAYVFKDPSPTLAGTQVGDIVVVPISGQPQLLIIKAESVDLQGDVLTVTGGEPDPEEVISYSDVNMDVHIDPQTIYYDESSLKENESVTVIPASGISRQASGTTAAQGEAFFAPYNVTLGRSQVETHDFPLGAIHLSVGLAPSIGTEDLWGISFDGRASLDIHDIHLIFRVNRGPDAYNQAEFCYQISTSQSWSLAAKYDGTLYHHDFPPIKAVVSPFLPPLTFSPKFSVDLSGGVEGSFSSGQTSYYSYTLTYSPLTGLRFNRANRKSADPDSISLDLTGELGLNYSIRTDFGIKGLGTLYGEATAGLVLEGKDNLATVGGSSDRDKVHDCQQCVDGDISILGRLVVGVDIPLVDGFGFAPKVELVNFKYKLGGNFGDFYLSHYPTATGSAMDAGFGECPRFRYRADIAVKDDAGRPVQGAQVSATYSDGRTDMQYTDQSGNATFYFPSGSNELTARSDSRIGHTSVSVTTTPVTGRISLDAKEKKLFIFVSGYEYQNSPSKGDPIDDHTEMRNICPELWDYLDRFPGAIYLTYDEMSSEGGIIWHGGEGSAYFIDKYDVQPGDVFMNIDLANTSLPCYSNGSSGYRDYRPTGFYKIRVSFGIYLTGSAWSVGLDGKGNDGHGLGYAQVLYMSTGDTWQENWRAEAPPRREIRTLGFRDTTTKCYLGLCTNYAWDSTYRWDQFGGRTPSDTTFAWDDPIPYATTLDACNDAAGTTRRTLELFGSYVVPALELLLKDEWLGYDFSSWQIG